MDSIKERPVLWGIGAVSVALVVFWIAEHKKKKEAEARLEVAAAAAKKAQVKVQARKSGGLLPWAIGDIDMWGDGLKKTI